MNKIIGEGAYGKVPVYVDPSSLLLRGPSPAEGVEPDRQTVMKIRLCGNPPESRKDTPCPFNCPDNKSLGEKCLKEGACKFEGMFSKVSGGLN